jgi:acetoacetate decarboxylase
MFRLQDDFTYAMPVHFGGYKFDAGAEGTLREMSLTINYETDRAQLENYIPEEFELLAPEITVSFSQYSECNYLAGGSYNVILVGASVRFYGKKDQLDGLYQLVVWENKTAPILTGREQTGVPKIYADINLQAILPRYRTTASYEGNAFLTMDFEATGPITGQELDSMNAQMQSINSIGWRYIPKVGAPGADLSQFILFPMSRELESAQAGNGSLKWIEQAPEQNLTQFHIINSLASLPMKKVTGAVLTKGVSMLHTFRSRVLE